MDRHRRRLLARSCGGDGSSRWRAALIRQRPVTLTGQLPFSVVSVCRETAPREA